MSVMSAKGFIFSVFCRLASVSWRQENAILEQAKINQSTRGGANGLKKRCVAFQIVFCLSWAVWLSACDSRKGEPGPTSPSPGKPSLFPATASSHGVIFADPGITATPVSAPIPMKVQLGEAPRLP